MSFGEKIKELRLRRGWSQYQLADKAGISRSSIAAIEGDKYIAKTDTLLKLAHVFGVPIDELYQAAGFVAVTLEKNRKETPDEILEKLRLATPASIPVYTELSIHLGGVREGPVEYIYRARGKEAGQNIEAYIAHGRCMEPRIEDGDIVVVDRDIPGEVGDIVLCLADGEMIVGQLAIKDDEVWLVNSENKALLKDCQVSAKIIEVIKRLS